MRTAEAVVGVLMIVVAVALALGAAALFIPVPPPGLGMVLALAAAGATVAAHGMAGRAALSVSPGADQRWRSVFYTLLVLTAAAVLPLVVEVLDLVTVAGFPLGFYLAAQGMLVAFAILAFRAARSLDAREAVDMPPSVSGDL
jgi:putative solute:sodium symporter small subunit